MCCWGEGTAWVGRRRAGVWRQRVGWVGIGGAGGSGSRYDLQLYISRSRPRRAVRHEGATGEAAPMLYNLGLYIISDNIYFVFIPSCPLPVQSSMKERLVRRRVRRLALAQEHFHKRRIVGCRL